MPAISSFAAKSSSHGVNSSVVHSRQVPIVKQLKYRKKKVVESVDNNESNDKKRDLEEDVNGVDVKKVKTEESTESMDKEHETEERKEEHHLSDEFDPEEEDDDSSSDEDEEELLQKELEKIKKERAEKARKEQEEKDEQEQEEEERRIAYGNPLLNEFDVKKSWTQDSAFSNQAKNKPSNGDKGPVNDLIRTEFHRKFINKYVK